MASKAVYVLGIPGAIKHLRQLLPQANIISMETVEEGINNPDIEILFGHPSDSGPLLKTCPNLKWYQCSFAGLEKIALYCRKENLKPKATITRFGGVLNRHMAEWTIAEMVARERGFLAQARDQEKSFWNQESYMLYRCLYDLTIAVIGVGDIGRTIAERCKQFDMTVLGVGRRNLATSEVPKCLDMYRSFDKLEEVLSKCDYICSVLPSTPATIGFFNGEVLKVCAEKKPVFINIGRGSAVSPESLLHALDSRWISHAILDVFEDEPLPSSSPLWRHPDVTISPHVSGCNQPLEASKFFVENYKLFMDGKELKYTVNIEKGY